jgi:hypothetical protein
MTKHSLTIASATALFLSLAPAGIADTQAVADGSLINPTQIGHIFDAACIASVPTLMERSAAIVVDAFGFEPIDLGTDAGWISPNGAITITVDGNPIEAQCAMSASADLVGDGAELYESLEAHLTEHLDGALPDAEYVDGGLVWSWTGTNASFSLTYLEFDDAFSIILTSEG